MASRIWQATSLMRMITRNQPKWKIISRRISGSEQLFLSMYDLSQEFRSCISPLALFLFFLILQCEIVNYLGGENLQALADMMEKEGEAKWGNWIGYVLLPFTIAIRDDPIDYVREAKATVDRKKRSLEAFCTFSIAEMILKLLGIKVLIWI